MANRNQRSIRKDSDLLGLDEEAAQRLRALQVLQSRSTALKIQMELGKPWENWKSDGKSVGEC